MKAGNSTLIALQFMALDRHYSDRQKEIGMASVITNKCHSIFLAKLACYLEDERHIQLQRHELEKEQYLRQMRSGSK